MQSRKFHSNTGSPVSIYVPWQPEPIVVPYYAPHLETDDKRLIEALEGSSEVEEVQPREAKAEQKAEAKDAK